MMLSWSEPQASILQKIEQATIKNVVSFILPLVGKLVWLGCSELLSSPDSRVLVFSLQCSLNMLEGDTGYAHV